MKKTLFISSWYPTKREPNFGVFVKEHAKAIQTTTNEIVVLAIVVHRGKPWWSTTVTDTHDENGVRTVLIEITTCFRDWVYHATPLQYCMVKRIFHQQIQPDFSPDIIHSNVIFPAGIIGHFLSRKLKKPHIITEHWTKVKQFGKMPIFSYFGKKAYKQAYKILPVSSYLQSEIENTFSINNDKFTVIGNVIDNNVFSYKEKNPVENTLRLCAIATWTKHKYPAKQPELLINAISEFQKQTKNTVVQLTMIGGGNKIDDLKALCKEKQVAANFTGALPKTEIVEYLRNADFFVHPTIVETFGVVIAEALMTGTPVICSNLSVLQERVNENNGILCENTIEGWVNGLKNAIDTSFNHKQIAVNIKNKYSLETIGKAIEEVYAKINN